MATKSPMEARGCTRLRRMSAYRAARTSPRRGRPVLAIGLISILAIGLGFLLGSIFGGGSDGTAGESTSASASASASTPASQSAAVTPSVEASASASPGASGPPPVVTAPEGLIPPGSAVRVLVDGLRIRESASAGSALVEDLPAGTLLVIGFAPMRDRWGPVSAEGFDWYPVASLETDELPPLSDGPFEPGGYTTGWVAAGDATEDYVELVDPRCPARPVGLASIEAMLPWELLACFGDEQITLDGTFGCGICSGLFPGTFEPAWLAFPFSAAALSVDANARVGPFAMRFAPGGPEQPPHGQIVRVVGHFDDPAATGCSVAPGEPPEPVDARSAELYCREQFVVESLEVTGTDPDFP